MISTFNLLLTYVYYNTFFWVINKVYNVENITKNCNLATYYYCDKTYKIPIFIEKGIKPCISQAYDENRKNITSKIIEIAGPNVDFYNMNITPENLGYCRLYINTDDTDYVFDKKDNIKLI